MFCRTIAHQLHEEVKSGNIEEMIGYLIARNFIQTSAINAFMVLNLYPAMIAQTITKERPNGCKQEAIWAVGDVMHGVLEERQIRNHLTKQFRFFYDKDKI